jgi:hypothetical protein
MNFLKTLRREAEPILRHFVSAALIGLFALALRLLQKIAPSDYLDELKRIDHILVIVLFWLFAGSTVMLLLIRLSKNIYSASKGTEMQLTATSSQDSATDQGTDTQLPTQQTATERDGSGAGEPHVTNEPVQTTQEFTAICITYCDVAEEASVTEVPVSDQS